jgi:hypothetical protein
MDYLPRESALQPLDGDVPPDVVLHSAALYHV